MLQGSSSVQRNCGYALFLAYPSSLEVGQVIVIYAEAELDRHGHFALRLRSSSLHRRADDISKEFALVRECGTTTIASRLGCWATKIHVDVVDSALADETTYCLT
jgi:hypothetical protein